MGILSKLFTKLGGFYWSLYICRENRTLHYAVHVDSPLDVLGYLIERFMDEGNPPEPWELYLNYNSTNECFKLGPEHFKDTVLGGSGLSETLTSKLSKLDLDWKRKGRDPVCVEVKSKKELPLFTEFDYEKIVRMDRSRKGEGAPKDFCEDVSMVFKGENQ